jgi:hypothetical protein
MGRKQLAEAASPSSAMPIKAIEDGKLKPRRTTRVKLAGALKDKDLERFGDET